ncbi:MAG: DUF86 domain-containing protein [Candidatus Devosia phytovorans]|uniref:DUF86 domain-containing protein n=1 Tax=Candidatus Devosia phytovorans TaxID=3121372 RepID=A0AAJ5VYB9_9HYPH|nr:HepT-like ribonuclease domain-containing protein [Devosia sp.]WEK06256.1 MAG: DUF86 domain-containing protein [Devosia sp.]
MVVTTRDRLLHIKTAINDVHDAVCGLTMDVVEESRVPRLAFERAIEIISEASKSIPDDLKKAYGQDIPWHDIASIGNLLRHAYHRTSLKALWAIYTNDLDPLEAAIDAMMAAIPPSHPTT